MSRPPLLEAWFQPLGLALRLRTDSKAVLAVAEGAFRGFGPGAPVPDPDLDFRFLAGNVPNRERASSYTDSGDRVRVQEGGSTLLVDRTRGSARGRFAPALLGEPARLRLEFLELALQLLLPPRGFLGVHGAAIVRDGRAALLRAPGGGGKTTLAYAAARGGFQVLAEDAVWIDPSHGAWWGLPWWFHPRPDAGRLFPELAGLAPALVRAGAPKLAVEMAALHPGSPVPRALPGPVVLLDRRPGGASRIEPLPLPRALDLWRAGRAGTEEDFPDYERRVEELLRGNAWRLESGDDLAAALDGLADLLSNAGGLP
jgi:hypothetical protein